MSVTSCLFTGRVVTKYYIPNVVLRSVTSSSFNPLREGGLTPNYILYMRKLRLKEVRTFRRDCEMTPKIYSLIVSHRNRKIIFVVLMSSKINE